MSTVTIPLTQGKVARIDADDWPRVSRYRWHAVLSRGYTWYARRRCRLPGGRRGTHCLHQFVLGLPPGSMVDHIDGDGLNNTRANLRPATPAQNKANSRRYRTNVSGYKGVAKRTGYNRWQAAITQGGKRHFLGWYPNPEDAARAYDRKARELFGPFAHCNFPDDTDDSAAPG